MILFLIGSWLWGFILFILASLFMPSDRNFTDIYIYMNVEPGKDHNYPQENILYIKNKNISQCTYKINTWLQTKKYERFIVIVPRFELFSYFIYLLQDNNMTSHSYKIAAKTTSWSFFTLFENYNQFLVDGISFLFSSIKEIFYKRH
jgi:hypothetical protein